MKGRIIPLAATVVLLIAFTVTLMIRGHRAVDMHIAAGTHDANYVDVSEQSGIRFKHFSGARGKKYMPETVGSGVAFIDYNGDGWPDLFFVNSTDWPGVRDRKPHYPALYRNNKNGTFTDVTREAGLAVDTYGMGAAIGDYDGDGRPDIYLTCIGPNHLFHNEMGRGGEGERGRLANPTPHTPHATPFFRDVTDTAGVAGVPVEPGGIRWKWSASAAWCDYNRDGILDLFVCNYVHWTPETDVFCYNRAGQKSYCAPNQYEGVPSTLYKGLGNGRFRDVSDATGISRFVGKSFGIVPADFNGDGWIDFAVTNDTSPNFLLISDRGERFHDTAPEAGIALSDTGQAKAGMGIDAADFDNSGKLGLLTGNFSKECLSLYRNDGAAEFKDIAFPSGIAKPSLVFLTFGLFFFDYDLDGRQDIFTANGHISEFADEADRMITYRERPLLYHNSGGRFSEVGMSAGPAMRTKLVGRGCAWGDYDLDGDPDIAIVWNNNSGMLWRNEGRPSNHWIGLKLRGVTSNKDGLGARIRVEAGGVTQTLQTFCGGSFLSTRQAIPLIGLGAARQADRIEIDWPSGSHTSLRDISSGRYYEIVENAPAAHPLTH